MLRDGLAGKLPVVTLSEFAERLDQLMAGKSIHTLNKTKESVRLLEKLCKVGQLTAIDRAAVMKFRAARLSAGLATASVNKDLRQIRSALSYAVDAGLLRANPLLRWKGLMLREPEKQVRVVEHDEFAKLLKVCRDPSFRAFMIVGYRQGLRRTELVNLRWHAIDLDGQAVHVVNVIEAGELTKSRRNRTVPMHPAVHDALSRLYEATPATPKVVQGGEVAPKSVYVFAWPDGRPYTVHWVSHEFRRLVKKAGIGYCTLHDLRRSFATLAQRVGVDKYTVKDLGGWSCVSVVEDYYTGDVKEAHRMAMKKIAEAGYWTGRPGRRRGPPVPAVWRRFSPKLHRKLHRLQNPLFVTACLYPSLR
ncbi:MAG: tyrosine-type recombinase/integrase [Planctomycetota bacterium]|nr:tyrosine-type recombinase/integrase [Planctomycetota bacterium]